MKPHFIPRSEILNLYISALKDISTHTISEWLKSRTNCSGSLSKTPWLAFIGNNWLKLNDSINSLWLDLIDAENILAHIK